MTKFKGPFDLIRLWGHTKYTEYYEDSALLEITVDGRFEVTPEILDGMAKSKFILRGVRNSIGPEFVHAHEVLKEAVDVKCEDDVPVFVDTIFTFKDYRVPAIEHDDKNDKQITQTEGRVAPQESTCTDCHIRMDHHQGDDVSQ